MEQRQSKRIIYSLEAVIISRSLNYKGTIKNITDNGICIFIPAEQNVTELIDGMLFEVKFSPPSREEIYLQCEVTRSHIETGEPGNIVGMKIIDQSPEYMEFLKTFR